MKNQQLFRKGAAFVLSASMIASMSLTIPFSASAAIIDNQGEYTILFYNSYHNGTIDGKTESKSVSFNFENDNEVVQLSDLVGNDVKYSYYAFDGWRIIESPDNLINTVTKADFNDNNYLELYAHFSSDYIKDSDTYYVNLSYESGSSDEYELDDLNNDYLFTFPKRDFEKFVLPTPVTYDGLEFVGWMQNSYYRIESKTTPEIYTELTPDDWSDITSDVISLCAVYKKAATENDTTRVITLDANGGTIDGKEKASYVNASYSDRSPQMISVFVPEINDSKLHFDGWNTKADGTGYRIGHTGFSHSEIEDDGSPGWGDIFEYYGDENENITLYAKWIKDPVRAETDSEIDQLIAQTAIQELDKYANNEYCRFTNHSEDADLILNAAKEDKDVTIGFHMEKDTSEKAASYLEKMKNNWRVNKTTDVVSNDVYSIYISVKADGKEIGRLTCMGEVLDYIEVPVPDYLFKPNSPDVKSAILYGIENDPNHLSTFSFEGDIKDNVFYAKLNTWIETDYEDFILVGKSLLDIKPATDSENDKKVAESVQRLATEYKGNPDNYDNADKNENELILNAYNSGKTITASFSLEKITPDAPTKQELDSIVSENENPGFTPLAYYTIKQNVFADGKFLTTYSHSYNSIGLSLDVPEINNLPEMDSRYTRGYVLGRKYTDDNGNIESSKIQMYNDNGTILRGYFYAGHSSNYVLGYYKDGNTHLNLELSSPKYKLNGQQAASYYIVNFNFLSDDEEIPLSNFFDGQISDGMAPYQKFLGWQIRSWNQEKEDYDYTDVDTLKAESFKNNNYVTLVPKFDEFIPKNSGKYYIRLYTMNGKISDLPDLGGKIKWENFSSNDSYFYDTSANMYIGIINSSDLSSITIPDPAVTDYYPEIEDKTREFLGWNCEFDPDSGTLNTHSSTITASDFSQSDVIDLNAVYKYPAVKSENYIAILNANGGLIDGKETAKYHSGAFNSMQSYNLNFLVPVRPGFKFIGWNTKQDGTGITVSETGIGSMTIFSPYHEPVICDENNNVTLFAQWEETGTPVNSVTLSKTNASLEIGKSLTLTAIVKPDDAVNKTLTWTSSNENVATVDNGKVTAVGNGTAVITAKASSGVKAECTVTVNTLINTSSFSSDNIELKQNIKITGAGEGGTKPYTFAYYYRKVGNAGWKTISDFTSSTTATFKPPVDAQFDLKVIVKDSTGKTAELIKRVTVCKQAELENVSTVKSDKINLGESIEITGAAQGGKPDYTYAYYYKRSTNTKWNKIGTEFTSSTSAAFKPVDPVSFDIKVSVKDSDGTVVDKIMTVAVENAALANNSTISGTKASVGETITLNGSASGGASPYTYAFYYKRSVNTKWNKIGTEFGTATTASFKVPSVADFDFRVIAKDSTGATAEKIFTVNVDDSVVNESFILTDKAQIGDDVKISGAASGGKGPYVYAFYFKRSVNKKWNKIGTEFGKATHATLVPTAAAEYDVKVIAKDSTGATSEKTFKVTAVESMELTNVSYINAGSEVAVNKTITIYGRAVGGTKPATYEYFFKRSTNSKWNSISKANESGSYAKFTPTAAASYDIKVKATDKDGKVAEKIFTVKSVG